MTKKISWKSDLGSRFSRLSISIFPTLAAKLQRVTCSWPPWIMVVDIISTIIVVIIVTSAPAVGVHG